MEDFNTYLLMSGSRQGGQIKRAIPLGVHLQESCACVHAEHTGTPDRLDAVNPSPMLRPPKYLPIPIPTPKINTARAKSIWGVNLIGINVDAILRFLTYRKTSHHRY